MLCGRNSVEVTASHRILRITPLGEERVPARQISQRDQVRVTSGTDRVVDTRDFVDVVRIVELVFHPDEPVQSFLPPSVQILSLGQQAQPQPRRRTRRPGMNRRLQRQAGEQAADAEEIRTADPFGFDD